MTKENNELDALLDDKKAANEEERGADKWDPSEGDTIKGYLMKTGWFDQGPYAPSLWLLIKTDDGDDVRVYCKTVLYGQVLEEMPAIGSGVVIRYEGRVQGKNNKYHSFTFVLVPDKDGNVKTDPAYWNEHGIYRGVKKQQPQQAQQASVEETGFF